MMMNVFGAPENRRTSVTNPENCTPFDTNPEGYTTSVTDAESYRTSVTNAESFPTFDTVSSATKSQSTNSTIFYQCPFINSSFRTENVTNVTDAEVPKVISKIALKPSQEKLTATIGDCF